MYNLIISLALAAAAFAVGVATTSTLVAGFIPGSLGLILADYLPWSAVYWIMAAFMMVGVLTTLVIREATRVAVHSKRDANRCA